MGLIRYQDGTWGVDYWIPPRNGRPRQRKRHKVGTKTDAKNYLAEVKRAHRLGEVLPPDAPEQQRRTLGDMLADYRDSRPHCGDTRRICESWTKLLGDRLPEEVTPADIRKWVRWALEKWKPATVFRHLSPLRRVYNLAIQDREITSDISPFLNPKELGLPKVNNQRERYLELAEEARLMEALGEPWCLYLEFALLTGMRRGNQFGLRKEDVDLQRDFVMLPVTKNGERLAVKLGKRAKEIVEEMTSRFPASPWVFPSSQGKRLDSGNFNRRIWRPARRRAGVTDFRWHDARHSAATRMVESGISLYTVQKVLGHKDHRTTQRYAHVRDQELEAAVEALEQYAKRDSER